MRSSTKIKLFPCTARVSICYSPIKIMHGENLGFKTHCKHCLSDFIQAREDNVIKNSNASRTLDCAHLHLLAHQHKGHNLLHLQTNRATNQKQMTPVPINEWCMMKSYPIAEPEGILKG